MSTVLTMMVRDESDIVACNIIYHLSQGVSEVIVTDNGSVDGTRDLLASLARSAPVTIIDEPPSDWSQGKWVTRMARMAANRFRARWVINGDADEFFMAPDSSLRAVLDSTVAECDLLWVARHDFVAIDRPYREAPPLEMLYRKRESLNPVSKRIIAPKVIHRGAADVLISQGCHDAWAPSLRNKRPTGAIVSCHYPIRSLEQFHSKVQNAGSGYAANRELPPGVGDRMRYWYDLLQRGHLEDEYRLHHFGPDLLRERLASGDLLEDARLATKLRQPEVARQLAALVQP
jgi:Glycosyl transferase family 2